MCSEWCECYEAIHATPDGIVSFPDPQQEPMPVRESGNKTNGRDEGREREGVERGFTVEICLL